MDLVLQEIRDVATKNAKKILEDMGVDKNDKDYPSHQYELQFVIYHQLKKIKNIETQ